MKKIILLISLLIILILGITMSQDNKKNDIKQANKFYNELTPFEIEVILHKATEKPFTGTLLNNKESGMYVCKQCNSPLYKSEDKFDSQCGWPSFDDEIKGSILHLPDADGRRTEIICENCKGHLGHIFKGEKYTEKNTRHCVNSISIKFIPDSSINISK